MDSNLAQSQNSEAGSKKKRSIQDYEWVSESKTNTSDLGKGSYGSVKLARDKQDNKLYAIKIIEKRSVFKYATADVLMREIMIQKKIKHPHCIRLFHCFEDSQNVYLVLEYAENGSLFRYLRKRTKFPENEAFVYFFQTCLGMDYLHKMNIVHRDLKPENLLLDADGNVKLCDFGWSASTTKGGRATFCGTIEYMAPEMIKGQTHDARLDIWTLGILLFEMLHGYAPFGGRDDKEKCGNILKNTGLKFDSMLSKEACDLIKQILKTSPVDRIDMDGIFRHPWMKKFEKIYKIDIKSYVTSSGSQDDSPTKIESSSVNSNSTKNSTEVSSVASKSNNQSAKIITIEDDTAPLYKPAERTKPKKQTIADIEPSKNNGKENGLNRYIAENKDFDVDKYLQDHSKQDQPIRAKDKKITTAPRIESSKAEDKSKQPLKKYKTMAEEKQIKTNADFEEEEEEEEFRPYSFGEKDNPNKKEKAKSNKKAYEVEKPEKQDRSKNKHITFGVDSKVYTEKPKKIYSKDDAYEEEDKMKKWVRPSVEIGIKKKISPDAEKEEPGFFAKLLQSVGCISRDTKPPKM